MAAEVWLSRLGTLNVYRAKHGPAPHKPLLLLVLLFLADRTQITSSVLRLTAEIAFHFETFWSVVAHRRSQRGEVRLPFFHLRTDGVWSVFDDSGAPAQRRETVSYAAFAPDFFELIGDRDFRARARTILISTYFQHDEQAALWEIFGIVPDARSALAGSSVPSFGRETVGRRARFRLDVISAYEYTCALTGYRLTTVGFGTPIDAAHIHPVSRSKNNDPRNGLALSKNAHWLFDAGLWALTDDYRVIVAFAHIVEQSPNQRPLRDFHGEGIRLPENEAAWPDLGAIRWHRQHRFASSR